MRVALAIVLLSLAGGCARHEFQLINPPELQRHIGRDVDQVFTIEPLEYRLRTVEGRLVMRIFNQTDESIQLLGDQSAAVDPHGQSHPLRTQTIAPHSFIKLIFPPMRPRVYDTGPTIGVGFGMGVSRISYPHHHYPYYRRSRYYYHEPFYEPFYDDPFYYGYGPRYLYLEDEGDVRYWDWNGQGEARITLVFKRGDKSFSQNFTFRRMKM